MENSTLKRRSKIRIILYISFIIIVLGIFGIVQTLRAQKYEREWNNNNQMALISLDEYMENLSDNLNKILFVSTPDMMTKISTDLWRESTSAKNSLSLLPMGEKSLSETYKFLSQIGEFVMSIQKKQSITENERQKIKELYEYSNKLMCSIKEMCDNMNNNNFYFKPSKNNLMNNNESAPSYTSNMDNAEQAISDFPSLIYDGPFSDHIETSKPKLLDNKNEITKEKGLEIAKNICKDKSDELKFVSEEGGNIPAFIYECAHYTIAITKCGGFPFYMLGSDFAGEITTSYDDAIKIAKEFLNSIGYKNMKESYYFTDDGICTINFAYNKNNITYYPDLIKVSVNLQNGEIISFDASGYIYNHHERKPIEIIVKENDAKNKINNSLQIISSQLCVIPTEWKSEKYCYELHCKNSDGQEILTYINCITGQEDNILLLLYSDGGVLTK